MAFRYRPKYSLRLEQKWQGLEWHTTVIVSDTEALDFEHLEKLAESMDISMYKSVGVLLPTRTWTASAM